jgi:tetratricopeptide (TPR) repeat protein
MAFYPGGKQNLSPEEAKAYFDGAFGCMLAGRYGEAFLCLSKLEDSGDPAVQYNLGLCHAAAEGWEAAIACGEKALALIKKIQPRRPSPAASVYKTLRTREVEKQSFLSPMGEDFPRLFADEAEQDCVMVLIYLYEKRGLADKAKALTAVLSGEQFASLKS